MVLSLEPHSYLSAGSLKEEKVSPSELSVVDKALQIFYIHNKDFDARNAEKLICSAFQATESTDDTTFEHERYGSLFTAELLTREQEQYLFRRMNFRKMQARQACLNATERQKNDIRFQRTIANYLTDAEEQRNFIWRANTRLVIAIAKKFAHSPETLDDYHSEGELALQRAIEKFNYARGFKFSTYATHAVFRNLSRYVQNERKKTPLNFPVSESERAAELDVESFRAGPAEEIRIEAVKVYVKNLLDSIPDKRSRLVLTKRFGLDGEKPETLEKLTERVGVTKERVRQIEQEALKKMKRDLFLNRVDIPFADVEGRPETDVLPKAESYKFKRKPESNDLLLDSDSQTVLRALQGAHLQDTNKQGGVSLTDIISALPPGSDLYASLPVLKSVLTLLEKGGIVKIRELPCKQKMQQKRHRYSLTKKGKGITF